MTNAFSPRGIFRRPTKRGISPRLCSFFTQRPHPQSKRSSAVNLTHMLYNYLGG